MSHGGVVSHRGGHAQQRHLAPVESRGIGREPIRENALSRQSTSSESRADEGEGRGSSTEDKGAISRGLEPWHRPKQLVPGCR